MALQRKTHASVILIYLTLFNTFVNCSLFTNITPQSVLTDALLENTLGEITWRYFRESRQILVLISDRNRFSINFLPYPRLVYSNTGSKLPDSSSMDDGVLLFIKDETYLSDLLDPIPRTWCTARFFIILSDNSNVAEVCRWFSAAEIYNVMVILPDLHMYTFWPYREYKRCGDSTPTSIPKEYYLNNAFPVKMTNMQGCPVRVIALNLAPNVIYDGLNRDGVEVRFLSAVAQKMNFTSVYLPLPVNSHWGRVRADGGLEGMIGDIYYNRCDLGFGLVTHNMQALQLLDYTFSLGAECLAWGVPLGAGNNSPPWTMLTTEFSALTWILITLFLVVAGVVCRVLPDSSRFLSSRSVLWYVCSSLVAVPVPFQPHSQPLRIFVATWLLFCIVINIAYQAELGSMVTVPRSPADIRDIQELLDSGLQLYSPWKLRDQLVSSYEDDTLSRRMVDKMLPGRNIENFVKRLQQQEQNIAYLLYRRTLEYYASKSGWKFHVVTSDCIIYTPITMVLRRGSPLTHPINGVLGQLYEGGFLNHWYQLFTPRNRMKEKSHTGLTLGHLFAAFVFLKIGLVVATLILVVELFTSNRQQ